MCHLKNKVWVEHVHGTKQIKANMFGEAEKVYFFTKSKTGSMWFLENNSSVPIVHKTDIKSKKLYKGSKYSGKRDSLIIVQFQYLYYMSPCKRMGMGKES